MADIGNNEAPLPAQVNVPPPLRAAMNDRIPVVQPPAQIRQAPNRLDLARVADSLEEEYQIGFVRHQPKLHRRYVVLRTQELFNRLHNLFVSQFQAHYRAFKTIMEAFPLEGGYTSAVSQAAACYISSWFWDLYVSNRESVLKLSSTAFLQYYNNEQHHSQDRYDPFLQHLNNVIKPTHIPLGLEDTLFIPLLATNINFASGSPFGVTGFIMNEALVQGILDTMDMKNNTWHTIPLAHDTLGRPMWLLDWRLNQAYAWFPQEGHFSKEDLVAAQILGIPCTPRLAPRDVDDWQFFPGNILPATINATQYHRLTPRRFYGAAEYRTIAHRVWHLPADIISALAPAGSKRPAPETSTSTSGNEDMETTPSVEASALATRPAAQPRQTSYYQYQLIDWCYHGLVVIGVNTQKQMLQKCSWRC